MPEITPKSLERVGSKIPRNIISSNKGANRVVVTNNRKNDKKLLLLIALVLDKFLYVFDHFF